jgi:hypothetical protein
MRDLGIREWTALAALIFGVLLAFVFLNPAAGDSGPRPAIERGDPPPTATPTPSDPPSLLPTPQSWQVSFASIRDREETIDAQRVVPGLDLQFDHTPFPDYRDDSWKVIAATEIELGAGSSLFTLHYDCDIRVFVDDAEIASRPNPDAPEDLVITFPHGDGRFVIRIEATDSGGPFTLRYSESPP